jgi:hypothetical protein
MGKYIEFSIYSTEKWYYQRFFPIKKELADADLFGFNGYVDKPQ